MTSMQEIDDIIMELDVAASEAQKQSGSVSWRKLREIAVKLMTLTVGKSLISKGSHDYLKEHHYITSTYIGLAKMSLLRDNPVKAMEYLQRASNEIDDAVLKHLPEHHAALQELAALQEQNTEKE